MRILAIDSALAGCSVAASDDGRICAESSLHTARGHADRLPAMLASVLSGAAWRPPDLDLIAVTVGPGSFTGIRAALSVALGLGLAADVAVAGLSVGEALAAESGSVEGRQFWSAIDSKRGRVFIERDGQILACRLDALPVPDGPIVLAGDAAGVVADRLSADGADVQLAGACLPHASMVAAAALSRVRAGLPFRPAQPLYIDAAATTAPNRPPRPPPVRR